MVMLESLANSEEQGVRLAQQLQVGPCIPVGGQQCYKRLKLAQLLSHLRAVEDAPIDPVDPGGEGERRAHPLLPARVRRVER